MKYYEVVVTATSVCLIQAENSDQALDYALECDVFNDMDVEIVREISDPKDINTARRQADYVSEEK